MTRDQADTLITALNTIEAQRKDQQYHSLTGAQAKVTIAIKELLQDEGFELRYGFKENAMSNADSVYSIVSQRAEIYND
jgi:hypothetical protein